MPPGLLLASAGASELGKRACLAQVSSCSALAETSRREERLSGAQAERALQARSGESEAEREAESAERKFASLLATVSAASLGLGFASL